ncbi:DNA alkylation repair protein [Marinicella sp. W31]|uniref:DNA alkylation repair protein n=1 Tax=Marinicella sp. W31 TaxID=3023713 RepID=UPI003756923D
MKLKETLLQLEALSDEKMRAQNIRQGSGDNQFGVRLGKIRKLAKQIKTNNALGMELWATSNIDARMLAILIIQPKSLSADELSDMVESIDFSRVADWLNAYIVKKHADKEMLRIQWIDKNNPWLARAGWFLTAERVVKQPDGLELSALLDRIESEMDEAVPEVQWTMNMTLVEIGIHFSNHRKRALAIGEKLGVYRDYPIVKGCTSPFAPIWINEMVSRQN